MRARDILLIGGAVAGLGIGSYLVVRRLLPAIAAVSTQPTAGAGVSEVPGESAKPAKYYTLRVKTTGIYEIGNENFSVVKWLKKREPTDERVTIEVYRAGAIEDRKTTSAGTAEFTLMEGTLEVRAVVAGRTVSSVPVTLDRDLEVTINLPEDVVIGRRTLRYELLDYGGQFLMQVDRPPVAGGDLIIYTGHPHASAYATSDNEANSCRVEVWESDDPSSTSWAAPGSEAYEFHSGGVWTGWYFAYWRGYAACWLKRSMHWSRSYTGATENGVISPAWDALLKHLDDARAEKVGVATFAACDKRPGQPIKIRVKGSKKYLIVHMWRFGASGYTRILVEIVR
jgi:hypothetical protein